MKKRILIISVTSIIITTTLLLYASFFYNNEVILLEINGSDTTLFYDENYNELGAVAKVCNKDSCHDISDQIEIENNITQNKVGNYEVLYKAIYNNQVETVTREVNIIDRIPPTITLYGESEVKVCPNALYQEEGYMAFDDYDGNITNDVKKYESESFILYVSKDISNNTGIKIRSIIREDLEAPTISLNGDKVINLKVGDKYTEYGATATDNCEGDISDRITISSNLNTNIVGKYKVIYTVRDSENNTSSITRTVNVENNANLSTNQPLQEYIKNLEMYIKGMDYKVSIGYVNLKTGYTYKYNSKEIYYGASLAKTMDALYLYENDNITKELKEKVKKAISVSDNQAHHELVEYIGIDNLRKFGKDIGCNYFLKTGINADHFGQTTVNDQITIWKYLYNHIDTYNNGPELKSFFINDYFNYLLFPNAPTIAHKYGYYGSVYHDTGIVYSDNPYIVVILTKHGKGDYENIVRDLSEKIYNLNKLDK